MALGRLPTLFKQVEPIVKPGKAGFFYNFSQMKRLSLLITIILCCVALCGCDVNFPFKPHVADAKPSRHFTVYVFGAVQNEGYVTVAEGADYNALLAEAGALPQTAWPAFPFTLVTEDTSFLAVQYVEGGKTYPCVNANGPLVTLRLPVENVPDEAVDLIADYVERCGKVKNKEMLEEILGEYAQHSYKFFISEADYEDN